MESPVKFDLSRLSYPALLQLTVPFVPGGVLVAGAIILNLGGCRDFATGSVPLAGKVTAGVFASFVAGIILHFTSNTVASAAGFLTALAWPVKPEKAPKPYMNKVWRKVARSILGPLAPETDELYFANIHERLRTEAENIQDIDLRLAQMKLVSDQQLLLLTADADWYWWHLVLRERFGINPKSDAAHYFSYQYLLATLLSVGCALLILFAVAKTTIIWLWALAILLIVVGGVGDISQWSVLIYGEDPHAVKLTARLLEYIETTRTTQG